MSSKNRDVVILDCGHGNLASVANAVSALGEAPRITADPDDVTRADTLIFPGQGAAPPAMETLRASGLDQAFIATVRAGVPTLGICLGMQLALDSSLEGPVTCMSLVSGRSVRFEPTDRTLKVPQMGWNTVHHDGDPLFDGIENDSYFYFVHSYYCEPDPSAAIGWTDYGVDYCSALRVGNFWATQFHPERSARLGLRLLSNFLAFTRC